MPYEKQTASKTIAQKANAYGIRGVLVDGMDVLAVHEVTSDAVDRARRGEGPTLIEAVCYRYRPHATADDARLYRTEQEEVDWRSKDPLSRFRTYLEKRELWGEAAEIALEEEARTRFDAAIGEIESRVTAEPVKEETGEVITGRTVSRTEASFISVEDPGGLPGFQDGLSSSWNVLQDIGGLAILGAGAILPFLWLVLLIGVYLWLRRRRSNETEATAEEDAM